ncbi:MAG: argininosuccinate lyase [Ruminococcaceae bacterium]|nr:argininosuccinate lyase [Oscillospiraceae bacterium]
MKLWGGRFEKSTDFLVNDFNSSIRFDKRMYKQDIKGSIAHAKMLGKCEIIPMEDSELIVKTLGEILEDIENGKVDFLIDAEDIHMNIETILTQRIGEAGKRLHTGRSRNDQVALDIRMYLRDEVNEILQMIKSLCEVLLNLAKENTDTIMPGYTHLQKAQPITLAHHLCAYLEMFKRDTLRLKDCYKRINIMPLGSGALAGTTYPLDREFVAKELGFDSVTLNSLDGVSDRDFVIELSADLSIIMMHLSRFCEELILWNTNEFSFVEMDDSCSTGSSIMPQKKNPDVAELIRGKSGRVYGDLMSILTTMKGIPLAYNKDMQEDKECIFDAVDTIKLCIPVFTKMIDTLTFNKEKMEKGAGGGFTNATDAADYLVRKGIPFREAHEIIGKMVLYATKNNKSLDEFTMNEFKACSDKIEEDIYEAINLNTCVNNRKVIGGPSKTAVEDTIKKSEKFILENF